MRILLFFTYLIFLLAAPQAHAAATEWEEKDEVQTRLVVGDLLNTGMRRAGIEMKLAPEWHSYWRSPGDAGMPLTLDWSASKNVKSVELLWPAPHRYTVQFEGFDPLQTYGYADHVLFPLLVTPENPEYTTTLNLNVKYAVCKELCLFFEDDFEQRIARNHTDGDMTTLIDNAILSVPGKSEGLSIGAVSLNEATTTLEVNISSDEPFENPDIFVEVTPDFKFLKPQIFYTDDRKSAVAKITYSELVENNHVNAMEATVTLVDKGKAAEKTLTLGQAASASPAPSTVASATAAPASGVPESRPFEQPKGLAYILLAAFIGGLILNIMPCVLPVLSLKLVGIAKHGGGKNTHVRASFLASAAGIIISFLLLATIVIALRSAGTAVGWGFHFQQPIFVIALIILINMFAANQWGLFEINLPYWLGGRISNTQAKADSHSLTGHFMTGVLATILATPCSAPYLGTAVGFALSQGNNHILLVFTMMGLGLAAPYLLLALLPKLITLMPRPGKWMLKVKHFMGYLLAATSAWLIWVLSMQMGALAAIVVATLSLGSVVLLYIYKTRPFGQAPLAIILVAGLGITFVLPEQLSQEAKTTTAMDNAMWQPFDENAIPVLVKEGKTVFVDVTADWCLTCKFNKINVLHVGKTHKALMQPNVVTMKADYTNPSPEITLYLKKNERYGIPFNIIYGPGAPSGIPLSEYLKEKDVLEALEKANTP